MFDILIASPKQANSIEKYGIVWHPVISETGDVIPYTIQDIELECFFNPQKAKSKGAELLSPLEHFRNLISAFWPEPIFLHNKVSDMIFDHLIHHEFVAIRGSASMGKTTCIAIWTKLRQEYYRHLYAAHVFSNSEQGLKVRYWKDCVRFHKSAVVRMFGFPNVHEMEIRADMDSESLGIRCRAVKIYSDLEKETSALAGAHGAKAVDIVIEEADTVRDSVFASINNIWAGVINGRFVALCNPVRKTGPMGKFCEPIQGYARFDVMQPNCGKWGLNYSTSYTTKAGVAIRLDARDSPGMEDPEKFGFLINKKSIEVGEKMSGISALQDVYYYITMGWLQENIDESAFSVITQSDVENKCLLEDIEFIETPITCAAIDMSYRGIDQKIFWPFQLGKCEIDEQKTYAIRLLQPSYITGQPSSMTYYEEVAERVAALVKANNIDPRNIAIDASATQDVFPEMVSKALGINFLIHGTHFQKWSPENKCRVSVSDPRDSRDFCYDRVTELHVLIQEFIRRKQIRCEKPEYMREIIKEGKQRLFLAEGKQGKRKIENKADTKKRLNDRSPDHLDCLCIMVDIARDIHGIYPGMGIDKKLSIKYKENKFLDFVKKMQNIKPRVNRPSFYAKNSQVGNF